MSRYLLATDQRPGATPDPDPGPARAQARRGERPGAGHGDTVELGPAASARVRARDEALGAEGWSRRFIGAPPRLAEMVELYGSLGHEVRTEPLEDADLEDQCAGCALALSLFRIVYTRSPA